MRDVVPVYGAQAVLYEDRRREAVEILHLKILLVVIIIPSALAHCAPRALWALQHPAGVRHCSPQHGCSVDGSDVRAE